MADRNNSNVSDGREILERKALLDDLSRLAYNNREDIFQASGRKAKDILGVSVRYHHPSYNLSSFFSIIYEYETQDDTEVHEAGFFLKYYESKPSDLPKGFLKRPSKPWEIEHESYEFLKEIKGVPNSYILEDEKSRRKMLLVDYIPGKTLEKELYDALNTQAKINILDEVMIDLAAFHNKASFRLGKYDLKDKVLMTKKIFKDRAIEDKLGEYLLAIMGKDNLSEIQGLPTLIDSYKKSIALAYEFSSEICHGDLNQNNVLRNGRTNFLDFKLKLRHPLLDVSHLISNLGDEFSRNDWDHFAETHSNALFLNLLNEKGIEIRPSNLKRNLSRIWSIIGLDSDLPNVGLKEEGRKEILTILYKGILHQSLRSRSKNIYLKNYFPEKYEWNLNNRPVFVSIQENAKRNGSLALERLVKKPGEFKLRIEEIKHLRLLDAWFRANDVLS